MEKKYVVIVDPYSTAAWFAPLFKKRGFECIAVHTVVPEKANLSSSFVAEDFVESIVFSSSITELASKLSDRPIHAVLPGIETGVLLADELGHALDKSVNDMSLSQTRRNKYLMQKAVEEAGLKAIRSLRTTQVSEAIEWLNSENIWPAVLKPLASGGADSVRKCVNESQVKQAFSEILGSDNYFGLENEAVLVQECIDGIEYVVDTISSRGRHHTTNICRYEKEVIDGAFVYKKVEYFPPTGDLANALIQYNDQVLDALGIHIGPSHSEIYLTDEGPVVVEVGARVSGGKVGPMAVEHCSVVSPLNMIVDSYVNSEAFDAAADRPADFVKEATCACLINRYSGKVKGFPGIEEIKTLPSYYHHELFFRPGQEVGPTRDLFSATGWVLLANADRSQLEQDVESVYRLESEGRLVVFSHEINEGASSK
jgi:biotin carboxylase